MRLRKVIAIFGSMLMMFCNSTSLVLANTENEITVETEYLQEETELLELETETELVEETEVSETEEVETEFQETEVTEFIEDATETNETEIMETEEGATETETDLEVETENETDSEIETEEHSEMPESETLTEDTENIVKETDGMETENKENEGEEPIISEEETELPMNPLPEETAPAPEQEKAPMEKEENKEKVSEIKTPEEKETLKVTEAVTEVMDYWDESWYILQDFRFIQVEKEYGITKCDTSIFELPDGAGKKVGEIDAIGLVYVLKKEAPWVYVESGAVRGFMKAEELRLGENASEIVSEETETLFPLAKPLCEISENSAFTYTQTTVQEVLVKKNYAVFLSSENIYEYPSQYSRPIGQASSGGLVYILDETEDGWYFVESADVRGFVRKELLLQGKSAEELVNFRGEDETPVAEEFVSPLQNRSCYYTLTSTKPAAEAVGEMIADFAEGFVGKLPYVYGGASLSKGADCSGFVQGVFAAYGIKLPRLAQEQGAYGEAVPELKDAKRGDVIYYASGPHVGIYVGEGKVVQCSGNSNNTYGNPGEGVKISDASYMPITSIRRYTILKENFDEGSWKTDASSYSQKEMELIWAIVAQEDNGSYEGALAVISSAMNRAESSKWCAYGNTALSQLTASGQYCYSLDEHWKKRLDGNVPSYVKQACTDCLSKGIRNHSYTSFRSQKGKVTGEDAVQIGGNWYFGS